MYSTRNVFSRDKTFVFLYFDFPKYAYGAQYGYGCFVFKVCCVDYFMDFEIVAVAPAITGFTAVFTFHMGCVCVVKVFIF